MKKRTFLIGAILLLSSVMLMDCIEIERDCADRSIECVLDGTYVRKAPASEWIDEIAVEDKKFGDYATKSSFVYPDWGNDSEICVYSVDSDGLVLCKSVSAITDVNHSDGKIVATVAKECLGYFAVYPPDSFDIEIGDVLDISGDKNLMCSVDENSVIYSGNAGDAYIMSCWCDHTEESGIFEFVPRSAVLKLAKMRPNRYPMHFELFYRGTDSAVYISPTWNNVFSADAMYYPLVRDFKVELKYQNNSKPLSWPYMHIAQGDYGKIVLIDESDFK